jgi:hypothetical protein
MGRMTHRFLAGDGLLLNRELRNEPKAAHHGVPEVCAQGVCPRPPDDAPLFCS